MTRLTDALGYATRLATTLWEKHYRADAPQWKPLPDLLGVLTQIDNMTSGLSRAIEAELSKQKPVARPRLPRIDHFAREAFEKFASGVECELTNYRWFEAGWDARGDTVAAAPLPSAPDTVQVPREPTQDMLYAMAELDGWKRGDREHPMLTRWEDYWVAALAAAPNDTP